MNYPSLLAAYNFEYITHTASYFIPVCLVSGIITKYVSVNLNTIGFEICPRAVADQVTGEPSHPDTCLWTQLAELMPVRQANKQYPVDSAIEYTLYN